MLACTGDTGPCPEVVDLARGAAAMWPASLTSSAGPGALPLGSRPPKQYAAAPSAEIGLKLMRHHPLEMTLCSPG
jgi:hypothetical protein